MSKRYVNVGEMVTAELPWSEVCMHLRLAGETRDLLLLADGVQIMHNGAKVSFPVTHGEAGFYRDADGLYVVA